MAILRLIYRIIKYKCYIWLYDYIKTRMFRRDNNNNSEQILDIMVLLCDHFEPARWEGRRGIERVREWCEDYKSVSQNHRDSDNVMPQHTWFYRYDYPCFECLSILSEYTFQQQGEIEFHLHHGYDTPSDFSRTLDEGLKWFNQAGAMISAEEKPIKSFSYIAGNWALDNGRRDPEYSGVNKEISLLARYNCYADFTFPAFGVNSQPKYANKIYYATDDFKPKSYKKGIQIAKGKKQQGDLMIFQGPLYIDTKSGAIEYASFETFSPFSKKRLDYWINADIHVSGVPEWKFVKLHTHGIQSQSMFSGNTLDELFTEVEARFKCESSRLHYVTAREAYNIVKAAEDGRTGNPDDYRDYIVKRPANRYIHCNVPYKLKQFRTEMIQLEILNENEDVILKFNMNCISLIKGKNIKTLEIKYMDDKVEYIKALNATDCIAIDKEGNALNVDVI